MPISGQRQVRSTRRRVVYRAASLFALVATVLLLAVETGRNTNADPPSTADRESAQRLYDAEFVRILATPSAPAASPVTPGERKVNFSLHIEPGYPRPSSKLQSGNYEVTLDVSHQVLNLTVPEDVEFGFRNGSSETPLFSSFAAAGLDGSFTPAAALALKAKQFDDGLYACVELASDAGLGRFPGKKAFLLDLLKVLSADSGRHAAALLTAAARLGGQQPQVGAEVAREAQELQQKFLADQNRSKVLGFYTWNEELKQVFQRDRMLQTPLDEQSALPLASALSRNDNLFKAYVASLNLAEKLTNPFAGEDLRKPVLAMKAGSKPIFSVSTSFFPPSQANETNLAKALFGSKPIPANFNLADEMVKRIRAGQLDLKPKPDSGWYDYQTYTLEPLVVPERMPEAKRLQFDESYRKELIGLFKALLALTRETHVKQLEESFLGAAAPPRIVRLKISPDLSVEPLATYYLRRARSYRFVRDVLDQSFGPEALGKLHRLTAAGPVNLSLDTELTLMETLLHGAYLRCAREIGMNPQSDAAHGRPIGVHVQEAVLSAWLASVAKDPDLGTDIRMMVPVFYDIRRHKTKVWAVLGIATKPLVVSYQTEPLVKGIRGPDGKPVTDADVRVVFTSQGTHLAYIVSAEVYVSRLLDRTEFRQLCDQQKTYKSIVQALN